MGVYDNADIATIQRALSYVLTSLSITEEELEKITGCSQSLLSNDMLLDDDVDKYLQCIQLYSLLKNFCGVAGDDAETHIRVVAWLRNYNYNFLDTPMQILCSQGMRGVQTIQDYLIGALATELYGGS